MFGFRVEEAIPLAGEQTRIEGPNKCRFNMRLDTSRPALRVGLPDDRAFLNYNSRTQTLR